MHWPIMQRNLPPAPGAERTRNSQRNQNVTVGDLEDRINRYHEKVRGDLKTELASIVKAEVSKALAEAINNKVQQEVDKGLASAMSEERIASISEERIVELVKQQAAVDENRNSGMTQSELEEKINQAVAKAAQATPSPPASATKLNQGIFRSMEDMKKEDGVRTIKTFALT